MLQQIEAGLKKHFDAKLIDELLSAHAEAKHEFYVGGLRLSAVEGGRFCEAAFRLLEQRTTGRFTDLNRQLDTTRLIGTLLDLPSALYSDSIRIHIPRALRVVYDVRNKRDAAHLADGIDPNVQDATLVISVLDWVLAEFVRLYHSVDATAAQAIVDGLVSRRVPAIQDFDGFLKVLRPELRASDCVLLLLYERGTAGASLDQLTDWVQPKMRSNLRRTLAALIDERAFVHRRDDGSYVITKLGASDVARRRIHHTQA